MVIEYKCKFCQHQRVFECEDMPADGKNVQMFNLELWKTILSCDRCADFQRKRLDIIDWAVRQSVALIRLRRAKKDPGKRADSEEKLRVSFTNITKAYAYHICRFENVPLAWEPDFVTQIMERPDRTVKNMEFYHRNIRKYAQAA